MRKNEIMLVYGVYMVLVSLLLYGWQCHVMCVCDKPRQCLNNTYCNTNVAFFFLRYIINLWDSMAISSIDSTMTSNAWWDICIYVYKYIYGNALHSEEHTYRELFATKPSTHSQSASGEEWEWNSDNACNRQFTHHIIISYHHHHHHCQHNRKWIRGLFIRCQRNIQRAYSIYTTFFSVFGNP